MCGRTELTHVRENCTQTLGQSSSEPTRIRNHNERDSQSRKCAHEKDNTTAKGFWRLEK